MTNVVEIVVRGRNLTKPEFDKAVADARMAGQKMGAGLSDEMGAQVKKDLPAKVEKPLEESGKRGGQKAGQAAAGGISPLITGAFVAAASVGPAAILGATALAVIGAGALITKGNADLASSYQGLGAKAADAVKQAAAPLVPELLRSVGVLDAGIDKIGPELKSVFSAAAPAAADLTRGLVSLVSNTLPGMASGLRAIAPFAQDLAVDFGKIGSGIGGFFQGIGSGAGGSIAGFNALSDILRELLTDIGSITGSLANGLGPALHDIANAALPVVHAFTAVIGAIPPSALEAVAVSAVSLFTAFKGAALVSGAADALSGFAAKASGATGIMGRAGAAAGKTASGFSMAAEALGGPWAIAIGAGIGLLAGWVSSSDKAVASTRDFAGAISQDSGAIGQNTNAVIQNSLAKANLLGLSNEINISQGTLIRAVGGEVGAQNEVTKAIDRKVQALRDEIDQGKIGLDAGNMEIQQLLGKKNAYTQLTGTVSDSLKQNATETAALADANATAASTLDSFSVSLQAAAGAAGDSAKQNATATLAALGLTDGTSNLTTSLYNALQAFTGASGAASAYKSSLDALYNKYADYSQAQATFTEQLNSAAKALTYGKDAVDLNTDAGAKNFTVLHQLANANEQVAESFINQGGSVQDANKKLQAGALAIDNMARKAGFSADQVAQLNRELYGTANIKDIRVNVDADTSGALARVRNLINTINGSSAYVQVYANTSNPSGGRALLASGGISGGHAQFAAAGGPRSGFTWVGEHGPELIPLPAGTRVHSNPDSMRMAAEAASGGGGVQSLRVEFVGGASDPLWELLRQHIRFTAGNGPNAVQTALGQH